MNLEEVVRNVNRFVVLIIVYILPAYNSYEDQKEDVKSVVQRDLRYWLIVVPVSVVISLLRRLLARYGIWCDILEIAFALYFCHPFFSGFEHIYDLLIRRVLLRWEEQIASFFKRMHDAHWKAATLAVQHIMNFFQTSTDQINGIIARKPPSKHIK